MAALGLGVFSVGLAASALADPPDRVARLAYSSGAVSFSPAGQDQWSQADLNRPLIPGDRLWTDANGRDEVQLGSAAVRMQGDTLLDVINVDDRVVQLQLSQGRLNFSVRDLAPDGVFEIDTPTMALTVRQPGDYRIDVDPDGNTTTVIVHAGEAQADGQGASWTINAGQAYRFNGPDLRNYQLLALAPPDEFDRWAAARDRRVEQSASARYVPRGLVGYDDLDDNGTWRNVSGYGDVWTPSHVAAGWTPYRDGHWAWVEPWGWTWVDDQPWGFAVTHYGRWANMGGNWGWIPGPVRERPVYAPALVAFVGGAALLGAAGGGVAWFPLGPREVYRPAYHVSQNYFNNINISNTNLNRSQMVNVYNNHTTNINYINRGVNGAVVAVPVATFAQSRPVGRAAVPLGRQSLDRATVLQGAGIQPQRGVAGGAPAGHRPSAAVLSRPVFARTAPPRQMASFGGQPAARPAPQVKLLGAVPPARPIAAAGPGPGAHGPVPVAANGQPIDRREAQRPQPQSPQLPQQAQQPHQPGQRPQAEPAAVPGRPGTAAIAPAQAPLHTAAQPVRAAPVTPAQQAQQNRQEAEHGGAEAAAQEHRAVHNPQVRPTPPAPAEQRTAAQQHPEPQQQQHAAPVRQAPQQQERQAQPQAQEPSRQAPQHQPQRPEAQQRPEPHQAPPQRQEAPRPEPHQAPPQHQEAPRPEPRQEAPHPQPKPAPQPHPEAKHEGNPEEHKQ
jgi:hypothetical protein